MSFRYSYTGVLYDKISGHDEDGNPVESETETSFKCDYQPTVNSVKISTSGTEIPISYKLYVSKYSAPTFSVGDKVKANNKDGVIIEVYPTALNIELWVK